MDTTTSDGEGRQPPDSLDMHSRGDRSKLAEAIRRGWLVDPGRKKRYMEALDEVVEEARTDRELSYRDRSSAVEGANRVYQMEQAAALRDLHQLEHDDRLDRGLATEGVSIAPQVTIQGWPALPEPIQVRMVGSSDGVSSVGEPDEP